MSPIFLPGKSDYHVHTTYSPDGRQTVIQACERALSLGLDEICFTDHLDMYHPDPVVGAIPDFKRLFSDLEKAQARFPALTIRKGLEIGDHPLHRDEIFSLVQNLPLDFYLLSLHLVNGIDPYNPLYYQGKTQKEAYEAYLLCKLESLQHFPDYDAVAHLGYVGKFAPYPKEIRPLGCHHGPDIMDAILQAIIDRNKALEINASGISRMSVPIPGPDIIQRYIDLGGQWFTFSSDAHDIEQIYKDVALAKDMAIAKGAKWELRYQNRVPVPIPLF